MPLVENLEMTAENLDARCRIARPRLRALCSGQKRQTTVTP